MKKYAYLARLEELLANLPEQERDDALSYYEEYIDAAGKEREEQTIAALGSPEEVAQKILEGEGLTDTADGSTVRGGTSDAPQESAAATAPAGETAPAAPAVTVGGGVPGAPQTPTVPGAAAADAPAASAYAAAQPKGPEPPPAFAADEAAPASYTPGAESAVKGFHPFQNPPKPFSRRGWILFVCVIAAAVLIQGALLISRFAGRGTARQEMTAVSAPDFPRTDNSAEAVPGTDYGTYEDHAVYQEEAGDAVTHVPSSNADGIVSLYDDTVQEIELHITSANLYISHDNSEQVHIEISGLDADKFETTYQTDDGRRKLVVRDGRKVGAGTPAEQTTVTLTLPYDFRDIEAKLVTGNITVDGLAVRDLELETGTGDIEAVALTAGKLDLKTNTGNITVGPVTPGAGEHEVDLKTGTGNIDAVLDAAQTDYEYEIKAQHGSVVLNNAAMGGSAQSRSGRYELEAEAYTGDISVTFAS